LQAQPFEYHTGCAQAHPSLLEIKKSPRGFLTVGGSGEFAYMLQAAAGLASPALRISHRMCAGTSFAS